METVVVPPRRTRQQGLTTSLYDLIEAIQNTVGPEDDDLVVATVVYLLRTGRIRFLHNLGVGHCN